MEDNRMIMVDYAPTKPVTRDADDLGDIDLGRHLVANISVFGYERSLSEQEILVAAGVKNKDGGNFIDHAGYAIPVGRITQHPGIDHRGRVLRQRLPAQVLPDKKPEGSVDDTGQFASLRRLETACIQLNITPECVMEFAYSAANKQRPMNYAFWHYVDVIIDAINHYREGSGAKRISLLLGHHGFSKEASMNLIHVIEDARYKGRI